VVVAAFPFFCLLFHHSPSQPKHALIFLFFLSHSHSCVELGVGSGYVSSSILTFAFRAAAARAARQQAPAAPTKPALVAVDVSPAAVRDAAATLAATGQAGAPAGLVRCDLAGPLLARLAGAVDVLAFNPPYVPTPDEEVGGTGIVAAWAGGHRGRAVLDTALPAIAALLAPGGGEAFIVTVAENRPGEVLEEMARLGAPGQVVLERGADEERLVILRCTKK
jgi:release factor glutamine methyltransferase